MNINRNLMIFVMLITGFVFAVSFSTLYAQTHIVEGTACACTLPIPVLIPTFSSLGILVGSFVYYTIFPKIQETEKKVAQDSRVLLDMLQPDEKTVIGQLVENKGETLQSKLSRKFGKVKIFRTIESLRKRGIVDKEQYGKTNKIKLSDKFREVLIS